MTVETGVANSPLTGSVACPFVPGSPGWVCVAIWPCGCG